MEIQHKLYTVAEFEQILADPANQDRLLELFEGEIVEKLPTEAHGKVILRLGSKMLDHAEDNDLGHVTTEAAHNLPHDNLNELRPDISFIKGKRDEIKKGAIPRMPDLAVEVKSPNDSYLGLRRKADYYLKNGSQMVWLIFIEKELIEVYLPNADVEILKIDDVLEGGEVLPGFSIAVRKVFYRD